MKTKILLLCLFLSFFNILNATNITAKISCSDLEDHLSSVSDYDFTDRHFFDNLSDSINSYYTPIGQEWSQEKLNNFRSTEWSKFNVEEIEQIDKTILQKLTNFQNLRDDLISEYTKKNKSDAQTKELLMAPFWFGATINSDKNSNTALQTIDLSFFRTKDSFDSKKPDRKLHITHQGKLNLFFNDYEQDGVILANYQKTLSDWSLDYALLELYTKGFFKRDSNDWKFFRDFREWYPVNFADGDIPTLQQNDIYKFLSFIGIHRMIIKWPKKDTNQDEMYVWWSESYSWITLTFEKKWLLADKLWILPNDLSIQTLQAYDKYSDAIKEMEIDTKKDYSLVRFSRVILDRFRSDFFTGSPWDIILKNKKEIKDMLVTNCKEEEKKFYDSFWKEPPMKRGGIFVFLFIIWLVSVGFFLYWKNQRKKKEI